MLPISPKIPIIPIIPISPIFAARVLKKLCQEILAQFIWVIEVD